MNHFNRHKAKIGLIGRIGLILLIFSSVAFADPMHSVMLSVPNHPEEALIWCGPASAQMIMEGYPSGSCSVLQEDIWTSIQSNRVETMWDTDPVGLEKALESSCLPARSWSVHAKTDPQAVMYDIAFWMTMNNFPATGLLNTAAHNDYTAHTEHWVTIRGIITDLNPTTNPAVALQFVWFNDPAVPFGDPSIERFIAGSTWYSEFQPVTKPASSYLGKYVAVIEPPEKKGIAIAPLEILTGKLISREDAMRFAAKWIEEYKLYEKEPYKRIKNAKALSPLLVNKYHGGYYIIPYSADETGQTASLAVIVNAYTGGFQEAGAFKPVAYMQEENAVSLALKYLNLAKPKKVSAELIFPRGEQTVSRYFPIWKVTADNKVIGVIRQETIYTRIPREDISLQMPGQILQGITWDGKNLWVLDEQGRKLTSVDSRSGAPLSSVDLPFRKPKGLAFDGHLLWTADEETKNIYALNPESGRTVKTIKMEIPEGKGFKSFEGIAWDGRYLWTAYFAGFSSSYNQIDPGTGKIIKSIFADCHPRGIASDGVYLWSICYNGENLPSKIDKRKILDKEHEMLGSRVFIKDIDVKDPSGLAYDGQYLWYSDRITKNIFKIYPHKTDEK